MLIWTNFDKFAIRYLELVSAIFNQIFIFDQMIAI